MTMFWSHIGGGVRKYLDRKKSWLAENLPEIGHLLVIPGADSGIEIDESSGHAVARVKGIHLPFAPGYRIPAGTGETCSVLKRFAPDIIESGSPFSLRRAASRFIRSPEGAATSVFDYYHAYFPLNYAAALGRPLTYLKRPLIHFGWKHLIRTYRDSRAVLLGSPAIREVLKGKGIGPPLRLAPLGVDLDFFRRVEGDPDDDDQPSLLFVGRLSEEKGLSTVLETYRILKSRMRVSLKIAGDGLMREYVGRAASRDPDLFHLGFLDRSQLRKAYSSSTLLLSAAPAETLGFCFLEALACGTPVVGITGSGVIGSLPIDVSAAVPRGSPVQLADACMRLIETSPGPERCRSVVSHFGWDERLRLILRTEFSMSGLPMPDYLAGEEPASSVWQEANA
jgi:alpha-1,6-mannosyltransferase